jgi:hypothetical protein
MRHVWGALVLLVASGCGTPVKDPCLQTRVVACQKDITCSPGCEGCVSGADACREQAEAACRDVTCDDSDEGRAKECLQDLAVTSCEDWRATHVVPASCLAVCRGS